MASDEEIESLFPGLRGKDWRVTSPRDRKDNCLAWAAGDAARWWWPEDSEDEVYWPLGVDRVETLEALIAAYAGLGYEIGSDPSLEPGIEKIALFADAGGNPTHAARQLDGGRWTSKLGKLEDIEHDLIDLYGDVYGLVARILIRRRDGEGGGHGAGTG